MAALAIPLIGLFTRVPWGSIGEVASHPDFQEAWWLSMRTCLVATLITVLLGTPLALWIAGLSRGRTLARVVVLLPMTLPPVVAGLALLATLGRFGLLGSALSAGGIEIGFTTIAVVIAQVFVAMPFFVVAVEGAAHVVDPAPGRALRALGAGSGTVLRHAVLPALAPALVSGTSLAFARALGEFGATLTFAGSLPGTTRTMPLAIYLARESDRDLAYTLAALLIVTAITALLLGTGIAKALSRPAPTVTLNEIHSETPSAALPLEAGTLTAAVRRPERDVEVDLTIPAGVTLALVGPNGSGKSTVMEELTGLLPAPASAVSIDGTRVDSATAGGRGIALLTQHPALLPHRTSIANVEIAARLARRDNPGEAARDALRTAGALAYADTRPGSLSGGQRALVALARALATNPQVILLDEPFAALDVTAAAHARQTLGRVLHGRTAVLVSHAPLDVAALADEVVVLERGRVAERAAVARFLAAPGSTFGQSFADVNALSAVIDGGSTARLAGGEVELSETFPPGPVTLTVRPERVVVHEFAGTLARGPRLMPVGELVQYAPAGGAVRVELELEDGQHLRALIPSARWAELAHHTQFAVWIEDPIVVVEAEET